MKETQLAEMLTRLDVRDVKMDDLVAQLTVLRGSGSGGSGKVASDKFRVYR